MTPVGIDVLTVLPDGTVRVADPARPAGDEAVWYVLAPAGTVLHPQLAAVLQRHAAARPDLHVLYGDAVVQPATDGPPERAARPDFDRTRLIAQDHAGLPIAVCGAAMAALGGLDPSAGSAAAYDLVLRAAAEGLEIGRVTEVLGVIPASATPATAADRMAARRRALALGDPGCAALPGLLPGTAELRRTFADPPPVTVLVLPVHDPGAESDALLPGLLQSLGQTDWPADRLHILLEDGPAPATDSPAPFALQQVPAGPSACLAARANRLWRCSGTEHLILLDRGVVARGPGWLRALMTFAVEESVGGVGARLLDPDGTARDAGGLAFAGLWDEGGPNVQHERPAVAGDAFATRRSVLEQANGFDERFGLEAGHADFCLRLHLLGRHIVHTPHAELVQRNPAPRDPPGPEQTATFLQKWQHALAGSASPGPDWWRQPPSSRLISPGLGDDLGDGLGGDLADGSAGGTGGVQPE